MGKAKITAKAKTKVAVSKRPKKHIGAGDAGVHTAKLRVVLEKKDT